MRALKISGTSFVFGTADIKVIDDLIEAIQVEGLTYISTEGEQAAAIMASVQAEITGSVGALLIQDGVIEGTAAINGLMYPSMDCLPLLAMTPLPTTKHPGPGRTINQGALFGPFVKEGRRLFAREDNEAIDHLLTVAKNYPSGPVHLMLETIEHRMMPPSPRIAIAAKNHDPVTPLEDLEKARLVLATSEKPILVIGMDTREPSAATAMKELAEQLECPVLTTAKAKGVLSDRHPLMVGLFHHGLAEADILNDADLIIVSGLDPLEVTDQPWSYPGTVVEITCKPGYLQPFKADIRITGATAPIINQLSEGLAGKQWRASEITAYRARMHSRFSQGQKHRRSAKSVVETAKRLSPAKTRLAVDGGAHLLSTLAFWPSEEAFGVLKSKTSSIQGYALPAAIAASLLEPDRPVLVVTNRDHLLACLNELATAARHRCNITILVMNHQDDPASERKPIPRSEGAIPKLDHRIDFAAIAKGFGIRAWPAGKDDTLGGALSEALSCQETSLVDVVIDPTGYHEQRATVLG